MLHLVYSCSGALFLIMMNEYQFERFIARQYGSREAKKCPRCNRGFVTKLGLFYHPDKFLCYSCWVIEKGYL